MKPSAISNALNSFSAKRKLDKLFPWQVHYFLGGEDEIRKIIRPRGVALQLILWSFLIISLGIQTGILGFIWCACYKFSSLMLWISGGCLLWSVFLSGRIISLMILCYQRYAPEDVRRRCMMMPSCSDYGLMSLNRHGPLKGSLATWKRLRSRCIGRYRVDFP